MGKGGAEIACEVCGYAFSRAAWRENQGYCPNCDQPISRLARERLKLPRADLPDDDPAAGAAPDESGGEVQPEQ